MAVVRHRRMTSDDRIGTVVDNNILRNAAEIDKGLRLFRQSGDVLALPEIALFEMTKDAEHWPRTVHESLRLVASLPEAFVLTAATKALGRDEEVMGTPTAVGVHRDPRIDGEERQAQRSALHRSRVTRS